MLNTSFYFSAQNVAKSGTYGAENTLGYENTLG